jgi:hypothetical protein
MTGVKAQFSLTAAPSRLVSGWISTELCRSAPHKPPTVPPYGHKPQKRWILAGAKIHGWPPPSLGRGCRPDHRRHEPHWRRPSAPAAPTAPKYHLALGVRHHRGRRQRQRRQGEIKGGLEEIGGGSLLMSHRTRWETPRGRYDEHNSKFSLSMKPSLIGPVRERNHF